MLATCLSNPSQRLPSCILGARLVPTTLPYCAQVSQNQIPRSTDTSQRLPRCCSGCSLKPCMCQPPLHIASGRHKAGFLGLLTVGSQTLARAIGSPQMLARFLPGDDQMLPVWVVVVRGWRMGRHHTAFRHAGNRTPGTHAGLVDASHGQPGLTRMHAFPMAHRLFSGGLSLAPQAPNSFGVHTPIATTDYQVQSERWRIQDALVAVGMSHRCAVAGSAHQHGTSRCLGLMPVCRSEVSKDLFATTTDTCIYMRSCHRSIRNMFCDFGQSSCQRGRPWIGSPMKHIDEVIGNPGAYYGLCYSIDSHAH